MTSLSITASRNKKIKAAALLFSGLLFSLAMAGCEALEEGEEEATGCSDLSDVRADLLSSDGSLTYIDSIAPLTTQSGEGGYDCVRCHSNNFTDRDASFYPLNTYQETLADGRDSSPNVIPNDPEESLFYQVVTVDAPRGIGRMPQGCTNSGSCLKENEIKAIYCWIEQGAIEGDSAARPPQFQYSFTVDEDAAIGSAVGTVTARGSDGGSVSYAITGGNTGDAFAIDMNGQITVAATLDRATTPSYTLTVSAADDQGGKADIGVTITVTDA